MPLPLLCPCCKQPSAAADFLSRVCDYSTLTNSGSAPCPQCGKVLEFRVRTNEIVIGYTYWAGSFHFEGMESISVPGLRQCTTGDSVRFELRGVIIPVPGSSFTGS